MGIIRRQSFWNTSISYVGVVLGFANKALLYTAIFAQEFYGLLGVLAAAALIGNTIAQLGVGSIAVRFMPYVVDNPQRHKRFNGFLTTYIAAGAGLVTAVMLLASHSIQALYIERSPLFNHYYPYMIAMFWGLAISQFSSFLCIAHLKTVLPSFMRDVGIKVWQTLVGVGFWLSMYEFDFFLMLYVAGWSIWGIIQLIFLHKKGLLGMQFDRKFYRSRVGRSAINYGIYSSLGQSSGVFVKHLDKLMVPAMAVAGLVASANYELGFFMATVIVMPYRALGPISFGVIARSFRERDMGNIENVYKKSSLNGLLIGFITFILIFINLDSFFILRPEFSGAKWIFFFLGLSYLFDMANGVNGYILTASKYFRIDLWINLTLIAIVFVTNYLMIPLYGATGAAMATAASLLAFNMFRGGFLWKLFKIQPFSWSTLYMTGIALLALGVGWVIPSPTFLDAYNPYIQATIEVVIRSIPVVVIYGLLIYGFRISPDMNELIRSLLLKVGIRLG